jgi:hypothetical protein
MKIILTKEEKDLVLELIVMTPAQALGEEKDRIRKDLVNKLNDPDGVWS